MRLSPEVQPFEKLAGCRCIVDLATKSTLTEILALPASEQYARIWGVAPSLIYRAKIALGLGSAHGGRRARAGRRSAPPVALLDPAEMGISIQVVGSGAMRTLVATLDKQPMWMVPATQIIIEAAINDDLSAWLSGETIEAAQIALGLNNRSVVALRKALGISHP